MTYAAGDFVFGSSIAVAREKVREKRFCQREGDETEALRMGITYES